MKNNNNNDKRSHNRGMSDGAPLAALIILASALGVVVVFVVWMLW